MSSYITVSQNYNRRSKLKPKPLSLIYYNGWRIQLKPMETPSSSPQDTPSAYNLTMRKFEVESKEARCIVCFKYLAGDNKKKTQSHLMQALGLGLSWSVEARVRRHFNKFPQRR